MCPVKRYLVIIYTLYKSFQSTSVLVTCGLLEALLIAKVCHAPWYALKLILSKVPLKGANCQ